jgi:hypothetical protein
LAHRIIRPLLAAGGLLALTAGGLPQAALGATPPPRAITVTITDAGFDKTEYSAGYSGSTADDGAVITFVNKGTTVHSAQTVPGAADLGATFGSATDGNGGLIPCWSPLPCSKLGATNTGGITPGGSVTLGFQVIQAGADYTLTSGPDCMFGNSTPGFNCAPITLHLVPIASRSPISGTMGGSVIRTAGDSSCDPAINVPDPSICFSDIRDPGTILGSPTKPVGDTTVTITDTMFDPTTLYVKDGSTVTWINKGTLVHSLNQKPFTSAPYNGFDFIGPIGLGPGESFSYNFHTYPGWRQQKGTSISANVISFTHNDIVAKDAANVQALLQGCGTLGKGKPSVTECGQPGLISKVITVPTANSFT